MILSKNKWKILYEDAYSDNEAIDILYKIKGVDDYINYFNLGFKDFYDPYNFKNMDIVLKKIKLSIRNNEKILIYGDYDVDGITATSILYRTLKEKGADIHFMLPNRFQTGYGLSEEVIKEIIDEKYNLVITVDNGITSVDEIDELMRQNITVILTDHHEQKEVLPHTPYIVHSYILNDYPFNGLCGVGVAFKIAEAIDKDFAWKYIDLVMLGTIADMMPQIDENRAFINEGLKRINDSNVPGIRELLKALNLKVKGVKDISYNIAPKLNALGRIGDASIAVRLLTEDDPKIINECLEKIFDADRLRKELTIQNTELAYKMIDENDLVNIIYSNEFYEGVLGIIAQKVMKKTSKITGVFNIDEDGNARGSFRTIGEYNLLEMLEKCSDLLDKFGGHEKACGVNLKASNLKPLKEKMSELVRSETQLLPSVEVSMPLNHTLINSDFYHTLEMYDLEETTFLFKNAEVIQCALLVDKHTKVKVRLNNGKFINVMMFNDPYLYYNLSQGDRIDFIGELNINYNSGYTNLQIIASDYKVDSLQIIDYRKRYDYKDALKFFNHESGLIIKDSFDNLSELSLLIEEQSPNIIYLGPLSSESTHDVTNIKKLQEAIFIIDKDVKISEMILQKELRVSRQTLNGILTIFEELNLVNRNNGTVSSLPRERGIKVQLQNSETYKYYRDSEEVNMLLSGPIEKIKEYVLKALE